MVLFGGACVVLFGGMCGFIGGCVWFYSVGGMCGFIWGHVWFYLGEGMHGFIQWGACVVLFGGHVWFYLGEGMHGFIQGGMCGFFSFFRYNEIRSMSGRYASYWNAFLYLELFYHYITIRNGPEVLSYTIRNGPKVLSQEKVKRHINTNTNVIKFWIILGFGNTRDSECTHFLNENCCWYPKKVFLEKNSQKNLLLQTGLPTVSRG